jgi:hypothetical protein
VDCGSAGERGGAAVSMMNGTVISIARERSR